MSSVSRAVRLLSSIHGASVSAANKTPKQAANGLLRSTIFSTQHFPKFLGCSMFLSFVAGYKFMDNLNSPQPQQVVDDRHYYSTYPKVVETEQSPVQQVESENLRNHLVAGNIA